jgi:hypothetical protein
MIKNFENYNGEYFENNDEQKRKTVILVKMLNRNNCDHIWDTV